MKKVAFVVYIVCVLLFSAFARAELAMPFLKNAIDHAPVAIEAIGVDEENLELQLAGHLPNPCYDLPTASLIPDFESPNTLILQLTSPVPTNNCVLKTVEYEKIVSLPVVAQNSSLSLNDKALYVIKTQGYPFEIQVLGSDLMRVPGFINQ